MADRPQPLKELDDYFAAAGMAHQYADDLHYKLTALHAANDQSRQLLRESATVVLHEIPRLVRQLRTLERQWQEQELLDPPRADRTVHSLQACWKDLAPELATLRTHQRQVVGKLAALVDQAIRP